MDRIVLALTLAAALAGGLAAVRWQAAAEARGAAAAAQQEADRAESDLQRLRWLPSGRGPLGPAGAALAAWARDVELEGAVFRAAVRRPPQPPALGLPPGLRAEPVELTVTTAVSPLAALDWIASLSDRHPMLLTGLRAGAQRLVVQGVILGR